MNAKISAFAIWVEAIIYLLYDLHDCTFNDQCSHHKETSQLICSANQLTGFYMMETLVVKRLILERKFVGNPEEYG